MHQLFADRVSNAIHRGLRFIVIASIPIFFCATQVVADEGFDLGRESKSLKLKKQDLPNVEGAKFAAVRGRIKNGEARMLLPGLHVMQPVVVTLQTKNISQPLELRLVKTRWHKPLQSCTTDQSGRCSLKLRTHGDLGLVVVQQGEDRQEFILDALIGPKIILPKRSPLVTASEQHLSSSSNFILYIALVVGILVLAIMVFVFKRRKQNTTLGCLLLVSVLGLTTPEPAQAEPVPGGPPTNARQLDFDALMGELTELSDMSEPVSDAAEELGDRINELGQLGEMAEQYSGLFERLGQVADGLGKLNSMLDAYNTLSNSDAQYQPDIDERGLPDIPSVCVNNAACQQCFATAHEKFIEDRLLLEELRIIYSSTKDFADAAMSFGDTVSGVHGVSGLAWQTERRKIEESLKNMDDVYDSKYQELIGTTHESLMAISACEDQFGMEDWYNRFGFIYFEFLRDKYKRN